MKIIDDPTGKEFCVDHGAKPYYFDYHGTPYIVSAFTQESAKMMLGLVAESECGRSQMSCVNDGENLTGRFSHWAQGRDLSGVRIITVFTMGDDVEVYVVGQLPRDFERRIDNPSSYEPISLRPRSEAPHFNPRPRF